MFTKDNNILSLVSVFAIGGLIGAGVALLMAPQSGEKTRSIIRDKSVELKDKAVGTAEDTKARAEKQIEDLTNQAKDKVTSVKNRGQEMVSEQKSRIKEQAGSHKEESVTY